MVTCSNQEIDLGTVHEDFSKFTFELYNSYDKPVKIKASPSCGCIMSGEVLEKVLFNKIEISNNDMYLVLPPNQKYIFTAYYGIYRTGPFQKSITLISETPIFENNKKELRLFIRGNNTKVFK
jgi:hypothetical protein